MCILSELQLYSVVLACLDGEDSFLHLSSFPSLSFITPVVKRDPIPASATAHRAGPAQQPCTPLQVSYSQTPQVPNVHAKFWNFVFYFIF